MKSEELREEIKEIEEAWARPKHRPDPNPLGIKMTLAIDDRSSCAIVNCDKIKEIQIKLIPKLQKSVYSNTREGAEKQFLSEKEQKAIIKMMDYVRIWFLTNINCNVGNRYSFTNGLCYFSALQLSIRIPQMEIARAENRTSIAPINKWCKIFSYYIPQNLIESWVNELFKVKLI